MTGWRVGYLRWTGRIDAGDAAGAAAIQPAGRRRLFKMRPRALLSSSQDCVKQMAADYQTRRDLVIQKLQGIRWRRRWFRTAELFVMVDLPRTYG